MDFDETGTLLVTSSDDETLRLYSTETATSRKVLFSKKYGIDLVRFTHSPEAVICASKNNWDGLFQVFPALFFTHRPSHTRAHTETIRYLSLYDNSYLRYFRGHRDRVLSLSVSPAADTFVSASLDATVRLWDLRQSACQGVVHMPRTAPAARGTPWALAAFDPTGSVFAVAAPHAAPGTAEVKLFDAAQYERGPFSAAAVPGVPEAVSLQFSPDGQRLLLLTAGHRLLLLDTKPGSEKPLAVLVCVFGSLPLVFALFTSSPTHFGLTLFLPFPSHCSPIASPPFPCTLYPAHAPRTFHPPPFPKQHTFEDFVNDFARVVEPCFTPDSRFVLCGSEDGTVHVWSAETGAPLCQWRGQAGPVGIVRFNPRFLMAATSCTNLAFWIPAPAAAPAPGDQP